MSYEENNRSPFVEKQKLLVDAIYRADRRGANALLNGWAKELGHVLLLTEVLEPALHRVGEEWNSSGSLSLAQVYIAGKVAEDYLTKVLDERQLQPVQTPGKGPAVIGNIEMDFHALGRRMVGTFLRTEGWIVYDLGNDVPPAHFVDKAQEVGAHVIGVSAMMISTARNIKALRDEIDGRGLTGKLQLAVGGAAFLIRPDLVKEVGGDGTATNALSTPELFDRLWERSLSEEDGGVR